MNEYEIHLADNSVLVINAGTDEEAEFNARYLAGDSVREIVCHSPLFSADEQSEDPTTLF